MEQSIVKISVRSLVEFVLFEGDLDTRLTGMKSAVEGTRLHKKIQKEAGEGYQAEVTYKYDYIKDDICLKIEGRADGVFEEDGTAFIDEIKSTSTPVLMLEVDHNRLHWEQAKGYAYIHAKENNLDEMGIQLTYCHRETEQVRRFRKVFSVEELEKDLFELIEEYLKWARDVVSWEIKRNKSIKELSFPFEQFRKEQRKLSVGVYTVLKEEKRLYAAAPTGTGKTIATLFPTIKYLNEKQGAKIFYSTAKNATRVVAEDTLDLMREKGLKLKSVTITAKDKICFDTEKECNPESCEYARGYYTNLKEAMSDMFTNEDAFTKDKIVEYAQKHRVCPFEFTLDLSLASDVIVCDYNYLFDPRVKLKRFFERKGDYIFLVDEAHNLVDRAKEMFSAELTREDVEKGRDLSKEFDKRLSTAFNLLNIEFGRVERECNESNGKLTQHEAPREMHDSVVEVINRVDELLSLENVEIPDEVIEIYFNLNSFKRIYDLYGDSHIMLKEKTEDGVRVRLLCLDPSELLRSSMNDALSSIMFSATLNPMEYFVDMLGGRDDAYTLKLASPFNQDNLLLMVNGKISTKFKARDNTLDDVVENIKSIVDNRKGNYMVFFPSYKYMQDAVYKALEVIDNNVDIIVQEASMDDKEREAFLSNFTEDREKSVLAFVVMGGSFGEGIDLTGDKLSGAIIVGVGLPQISFEKDIEKNYFMNKGKDGFKYAYVYPGMSKVLQAAGRVIRTENDTGVVLLIDERFNTRTYRELFPGEWSNAISLHRNKEIGERISEFQRNLEKND